MGFSGSAAPCTCLPADRRKGGAEGRSSLSSAESLSPKSNARRLGLGRRSGRRRGCLRKLRRGARGQKFAEASSPGHGRKGWRRPRGRGRIGGRRGAARRRAARGARAAARARGSGASPFTMSSTITSAGPCLPCVEKRRGEPELRARVPRLEGQGALAQRLGLRKAAAAQHRLGHVQEQRQVVRRQAQRIAERGRDERGIERIRHSAQ